MWAFFAGFFGARVLRDSRTPDSVKQQRYDAHRARRSWSNPNVRIAWAIVGGCLLLAAVANLFR